MTNSTPPNSAGDNAVVATNLRKQYGAKLALHDLSLTLPRRGVTAILGANGAGKTTFIRCVLGLTPATSGTLRVFGERPGSDASRQRTGVMLQDADLPDLLTAREHLTLFASYYDNAMSVEDALQLCELEAFADKRYKTLSGGQKRRVQFALAVVGQPDLLFLDEPTTGLDSDARRTLWRTVRSLAARGASIVLTTHYLEEADALADAIIILKDGQVLAHAPTPQIRMAVGGAMIRCVTTLDPDACAALDGARTARRSGRFMEILCADPAPTLQALFAADPAPTELTVAKPGLEDAVADFSEASLAVSA
ncbi:MAG: ABC transporter ATP-binding protein [Gammaproteobacteria bacterium]